MIPESAGILTAVDALGGAGFGDDNLLEDGKSGFQLVPDPFGDVLAGGVFETGDFIEVMVVQLLPVGFEGLGNFRVVDQPAQLLVAVAFDHDLGAEAVAVKAAALVVFRQVRQQVCGFELE